MPRGCFLSFFGGYFENAVKHFAGDIQEIKNGGLFFFGQGQHDLKELLIASGKLQTELLILLIFR